ncbi:MAG: D-alanyl-D-alanine carboxypeptidase family protein [Bacillota bacterium]|nr:D-alanyl-D-alanine carboxypeptidase family protein [Bacillota bacterium]
MKSVKKCFVLIIVLALFTTSVFAIESAPQISASSAVLVEPSSGEIIYEKKPHEKAYPASTTKMMTALIAMEKGNLNDVVKINETAIDDLESMGSGANLHAGESYTLHDLLYLLLLSSENDAANAIAEHIAGSQSAFVDLMNERAEQIGMKDTHFANPHGLHDENHYTSAYDLYLLAKEGLKNKLFAEITSTSRTLINNKEVLTTNHLISRFKDPSYYYSYASGIKTGFTTPAGYCLASTAERNKVRYICVVMGSKKDETTGKIGSFVDSKALYEWAFSNYEKKTLLSKSTPVKEISVKYAKDKDYLVLTPETDLVSLVPKDLDASKLTFDCKINSEVAAPVKKGEVLGSVTVLDGDKNFGTIKLVAMNDVNRSTFLYILSRVKNFFTGIVFKILGAAVILLAAALLIIRGFNLRRRRRYNHRTRYDGSHRRR